MKNEPSNGMSGITEDDVISTKGCRDAKSCASWRVVPTNIPASAGTLKSGAALNAGSSKLPLVGIDRLGGENVGFTMVAGSVNAPDRIPVSTGGANVGVALNVGRVNDPEVTGALMPDKYIVLGS